MRMKLKLSLLILIAAGLSACTTAPLGEQGEKEVNQSREQLQKLIAQAQRAAENTSGFYIDDEPAISVQPLSEEAQAAASKAWLTQIRVTLGPGKEKRIPGPELIRMLRTDFGLNITTTVPLDAYSYSGFGVSNADAETALQILLGTMGLDYDVDNKRKVVIVQPMKPRTWILNLGNRRTSYSSGVQQASGTGAVGASPAPFTPPMASTLAGSTGSTTSAATAMGSQNSNPSTTGIAVKDDFWASLNQEIKQRLTILVPRAPVTPGAAPGANGAPMPTPMPTQQFGAQVGGMPGQQTLMGGSAVGGTDLYVPQAVGNFTINPETGAIWVQAPSFVLKGVDEYITKIQEKYNTLITFEGRIVTVTSTKNISEGLDWTAFNSLAGGEFTSVIQNNIIGGAVISSAVGTNNAASSISIGNTALPGGGSVLGVMSASKQFALFNAFLSTYGLVKVVDRPLVNTTNGMPVKFEKRQLSYFPRYNQTAASGGVGSATVATTNEDVPYTTGVTLTLNPQYDSQTGLVRAQFSLQRVIQTGWSEKINYLTTSTGFQSIPSRTPKLSDSGNEGEFILKDGDMIVVGGSTEDTEDNSDNGITGLMDTPLGGVLAGSRARNKASTTYYFAIRVTVKRKQ